MGTLGGVPHRHLVVGSLYASRPLFIGKSFAASYIGEVFPLLIATRVPRVSRGWFFYPGHTDSIYTVRPEGQGVVPGVGVLPVGLRLSHRVSQSALLFADASGGAAAFTRAMPEPDARALNFLGSVGFGVQLGKSTRRYLLGYRFTHISNAYTARSNPGFNAHILYLGLTIR